MLFKLKQGFYKLMGLFLSLFSFNLAFINHKKENGWKAAEFTHTHSL